VIAKLCERCGTKPQGYHGRRWCYDCKRGSGGRPLPCRRCGSSDDYWTEGLCRRCHQFAPQRPESCRDCLAWGVWRTHKWLCGGCLSWRFLHPTTSTCRSCHAERSVNEHTVCRLCWKQTKLVQDRLRDGHRGPLNIVDANRYGQQLFLANMASSKNGYRSRARRPEPPPTARPTAQRAEGENSGQLDLFTRDRVVDAARLHGFPDPPDIRLADLLDQAVRDHAARHGWHAKKIHAVRTAIRVLLGMRGQAATTIRTTDVARLPALDLPARPVLAVLRAAGLLEEDRPATIQVWVEQRLEDLPEPMASEVRTWFQVLHRGSSVPPRSRPRAPVTIKTRLMWSLPTLQLWAAAGHQSLREISRQDVLAALPASGTPRAQLGNGLRSIFGTLKAHKLVFVNPMSRVQIGSFERRVPLPADPARLRAALNSPDPPGAALAALIAFHGLRPLEVRDLKLTEVRDGRLHLSDRTLPLAQPVKVSIAAYLDYRHARWPNSINPHLFIHYLSAGSTLPVTRHWINDHLGMSAQAIRQDRIVDEAHATAGDLRRICDFFGVTMATAEHYAGSLNHAELEGLCTDTDVPRG
jgi:integrase